jgi:hypothetical protein
MIVEVDQNDLARVFAVMLFQLSRSERCLLEKITIGYKLRFESFGGVEEDAGSSLGSLFQ